MIRFLFLISLLFSCDNKKIINDVISLEDYAIEKIYEVTITHTLNGKLKAKIEVGKMERFYKNQTIFLSEGVKINFYNKNAITSTLTSEKAEIDEKNNFLKALINVTLSDKVDKTLNCNSLIWNRVSDEVYTEEGVTIETNDEIIYGSGFKSDSKFEKYHIKNVKGNFSFEIES